MQNELFRLETEETRFIVTQEDDGLHIHLFDMAEPTLCIEKEFADNVDHAVRKIRAYMKGEGI